MHNLFFSTCWLKKQTPRAIATIVTGSETTPTMVLFIVGRSFCLRQISLCCFSCWLGVLSDVTLGIEFFPMTRLAFNGNFGTAYVGLLGFFFLWSPLVCEYSCYCPLLIVDFVTVAAEYCFTCVATESFAVDKLVSPLTMSDNCGEVTWPSLIGGQESFRPRWCADGYQVQIKGWIRWLNPLLMYSVVLCGGWHYQSLQGWWDRTRKQELRQPEVGTTLAPCCFQHFFLLQFPPCDIFVIEWNNWI